MGYVICEFDSLRGLWIDIDGTVHFDNRDRFAVWIGGIGKATEPCQQTSGCWHLILTVSWTLTWEMIRIRNCYYFMYRQHIWLRKWGDCWGTWLIMLGFMDLGWPRVCRRPTSVLLNTSWWLINTIPAIKLLFGQWIPHDFQMISPHWFR